MIRLQYVENGPMRPTITDLEQPDLGWVENDYDPLNRECECDGEECDPETCPRFTDECAECGKPVPCGAGAFLMDGGETYGECCIQWVGPVNGG